MDSKSRCIATIKGEKPDRIPVFPLLMFFAKSRLGINYKTYASEGSAMAEAQINIKEKFPIDAITACSDAFRITADLGADMVFPDDKPPYASAPLIANEYDLKHLKKKDLKRLSNQSRMADRILAVESMVRAVGNDSLVLGWVDMPFAEACSVCGVSNFMMMMLENPQLAHDILDFLTGIVIEFALRQLEVGAPMIGAGDAAASLTSTDLFREFVLPYEQRVCSAIHNHNGLVKLHICGNTSHILEEMANSGADLFNVDHMVNLEEAKNVYGKRNLCYKGNLDPVVDMLQSTPDECEKKSIRCLEIAKDTKYMLSAGCEIPEDTKDEVFEAFCRAVDKV